MNRPTRQEQAQAILHRKARKMASTVLGRRATTAADFSDAFTLERVDVISEIPDRETLLSLGLNRVGPRDGLYIFEDKDGYRVYVQERGIPLRERRNLPFDEAQGAVIDELVLLNGIPFSV
jgi:PAS domain-containing protein